MTEAEFEAEIASLRRTYIDGLARKVAEVATALATGGADPAALAPARRTAHNLRGTAGAYGFTELGERAARLEDAILALASGASGADPASVTAAFASFAEEVRRIVAEAGSAA